MITAKNIHVKIGRKEILRDISFEVHPGMALAILGPVGSGKTTLLRTLVGLIHPYKGQVKRSVIPFYIPSHRIVPPASPYTLCDFVSCSREKLKTLCRKWQIDPHRRIHSLSEGEWKLAMWAVALASPHPIIVADEPWQGMDMEGREMLRKHLIDWVFDGNSLILASHLLWEVERIADQIIVLNKGKVITGGELDTLKTQYKGNLETIYKVSIEGSEVL